MEIISQGTLDTILVNPREVFYPAICRKAAAIALAHNLCAAAHKLCYVKRRVMCSHRLAVLTLTRSIAMAVDGFTSPDGCGKNANLGFTAKGCYV